MRDDRPLRLVTAGAMCAVLLIAVACDRDGGGSSGGSTLEVSMSSTPPGAGQDLLWLAEGERDGDLLVVDVIARDITQPFDAYEIEVAFDPLVLRAASSQDGSILESCSNLGVLFSDNIGSGGAASGSLLVAAVAPDLPVCTAMGERVMARLVFQAIAEGSSVLSFVPANNDPADPRGSRLFRSQSGPPFVPVTFFDSQALVTSQH